MNIEEYWASPPPEPSAGLLKWQQRIRDGFMPNRRLRQMGYYESAEFYDVYIWEYIHVIAPLLKETSR